MAVKLHAKYNHENLQQHVFVLQFERPQEKEQNLHKCKYRNALAQQFGSDAKLINMKHGRLMKTVLMDMYN